VTRFQYLAALSGGAACSSSSSIERQVLESNPLLEAFGNAKTIRNDNSSRFGKFIRIGFDANGKLTTAQIETYLLEKSRVTYVAAAERSYHIFYQLCAVAVYARDDVEMESSLLHMFRSLQVGPCSDYVMLTRNEAVRSVDGVDDLQSFFRMAEAMATINLSPDSLSDVCRIVAAILHLSNVKMVAVSSSAGSDSSTIAEASTASVANVASLIGCTPLAIAKALCFRSIKTNEETVVVPNTKVQASDARDALSKALYGRLFDWIVARINESFTASASQQKNFIGILDIFGFEFFETNSFEQLCINYANEMLQNQFNAFVFQLEQKEYAAEDIPWSFIEFFDNKPCLEAIGGKSGSVLACLDEECLVPAGNDSGFCNKVRAIKNKFLKAPPKNQAAFIVCHYAGTLQTPNPKPQTPNQWPTRHCITLSSHGAESFVSVECTNKY
jgi:myosin-5